MSLDDGFPRNAQAVHAFCISLDDDGFSREVWSRIFHYRNDIESFNREINQWYITFLDCSGKSYSSSLVKDELVEFTDSLVENLLHFLCWRKSKPEALVELTEALLEKLIFLKNFIRFVTFRGVDYRQLGRLFTHIEAVAVNAAHLSYMCEFNMEDESNDESDDESKCKEMQRNSSELLQKINPVEPQVYTIYVQALNASKLSGQSNMETDDEHILEDFTASLFCNLWEKLKSGTHFTISVKDHLQMLLEGLRSLRTILREQPKNFDDEMRHLSGAVICDAGVVICSLFLDATKDGLAKETEILLFDLLERIKLIRVKVCPKFGETSTLNFPKTNELGFVDFLLENLKELTRCKMGPIALGRSQIQTIHEELAFLRSFLGKIVKSRNEREELQALWSRVVEVAYRVEFLTDSLVVGDITLVVGDITDSSPMSFDSIIEEIKILKSQALKIFYSKSLDVKLNKITKRLDHMPLQRSTPKIEDVVVGLDDEAKSIMDRLTRGSNQLQIVAIVGMPGLGKTTLSKIVYNDESIESRFHTRAWCCVSQVYHKKNLLLEILTCIFIKLDDKYFEMTEEDLALELYRSLKRKRYLILLDDVWDIEAWNSLEASFPNDTNSSRILLTSRLRDVAPQDKLDQEPHFLRQLTQDESWNLLKAKLFPREDWPSKFHEIGLQIVDQCKGLPLAIVILAGILATTNQESWNEVVGSLSSRTVSSTEQCRKILELSYSHLPDKLKPCLLYFGAFPEDQEIPAKKLTWLWLAEGFVRKNQSKSHEDKAKDYLMHLICRSLVMVAKQSSTGGVKTCRIHDLLHEFCVEKAKEENFFQLLQGYDELSTFNEPHNLCRLSIHSKPEDFKRSRLFCPRVRSLLFFDRSGRYHRIPLWFNLSFVICIFKLVRVLDLGQIHLGYVFPNEIQFLVQLRYLAVQGNMESIPSSIANLSNLETFIVESFRVKILLPDAIWSLKKLRHVEMMHDDQVGFCFPMDSIDKSGERSSLVTFSVAILSWENIEMILRKFANIRKLNLKLDGYEDCAEESNKILVLDFLSRLESLDISPFEGYMYQVDFCFPLNLRKLSLSCFSLPWCKISTIGNLPNLEVLKLLIGSFGEESWHMEAAGEFPKLSFLKLSSLKLCWWTASESEDHFPCLRKLVIEDCWKLREVPSCLGYISTLETIEVHNSSYAASSVKQIQKEQMDMGNMDLKVLIHLPLYP